MADISIDPDSVGIRDVLAGVRFPAPRWQLVAHAQHWGATPSCITELVTLPVRDYRSLNDVAAAIGQQRSMAARGPAEPRPDRPVAPPPPGPAARRGRRS
ncbi:MAG TPA: DUF2795 domain-containing protein [Pseudonocardia sp.]|jgi:hypothetical protein|nr:DUF2795 domain-containing protein [Pseudonocardia sp.]